MNLLAKEKMTRVGTTVSTAAADMEPQSMLKLAAIPYVMTGTNTRKSALGREQPASVAAAPLPPVRLDELVLVPYFSQKHPWCERPVYRTTDGVARNNTISRHWLPVVHVVDSWIISNDEQRNNNAACNSLGN